MLPSTFPERLGQRPYRYSHHLLLRDDFTAEAQRHRDAQRGNGKRDDAEERERRREDDIFPSSLLCALLPLGVSAFIRFSRSLSAVLCVSAPLR